VYIIYYNVFRIASFVEIQWMEQSQIAIRRRDRREKASSGQTWVLLPVAYAENFRGGATFRHNRV